MEKERIILSDCDGVLVNWNKGFESFMETKGHPKIADTEDDYSMAIRHGVNTLTAQALIKEYNEGPCIADLEPFADSIEYVKKLADDGFRFIVVTSISDAPEAKFYRTKNLAKLFGDVFDDIHCITMGASKAHILMNWADTGYFWIEDHMRQAEAGYEAGLKTILIDHPYNTHYNTDLFPKVSVTTPWKEIYDIITTEYNK